MMRRVAAGASMVLLVLAGCAGEARRPGPVPEPVPESGPGEGPRDEPRARSGNPPFYEISGRRYVVLASAAGYIEQGVASWYGPDFHGGRTATGEVYDMHAMTGAHPTLPLPTWVRVTNLQNGRSVVVRLNDRGPFAGNRIIDLSKAAAQELDMIRAGTAMVEVRSLASGSQSAGAPPAPAGGPYHAQAGAFADEDNARHLARQLEGAGITGVSVSEVESDGRRLWRVLAGPVPDLAAFDALVERMRAAGVDSPRLALP